MKLSELDQHNIYAYCDDCDRRAMLPKEKLIEKFGGDFEAMKLRSLVRCSNCGEKTNNIRFVYDATMVSFESNWQTGGSKKC